MATCATCGRDYDPDNIQGTHPFRHPVDGPLNDSGQMKQSPNRDPVQGLTTDPILRLVLIEKGLITVADLDAAEAKLKASGMVIAEEPADGKQNP